MISLIMINLSCKETKDITETASNITLEGSYTVISVNGTENKTTALSLNFNSLNKVVSGNAGCNDFSGNYSLDSFTLNIGVLTATEAYCDDDTMKVERNMFGAIRNIGSYEIKKGILTLYSKVDRTPKLTAKKNK